MRIRWGGRVDNMLLLLSPNNPLKIPSGAAMVQLVILV